MIRETHSDFTEDVEEDVEHNIKETDSVQFYTLFAVDGTIAETPAPQIRKHSQLLPQNSIYLKH